MNSRAFPVVAFALLCTACRHDMQVQPKYTPLARSKFFPDGRASRPTPPGTIAIDETGGDPALMEGRVNGAFDTTIPVPVTTDLLQRGQDRFDIYCAPCHARTGEGNGMIAQRGFRQPADLTGARVRNAPPGYIYQVIVHGYGAMADYAYQLKNPRDRWAIVAYIRALELSSSATLGDVPAAERPKLEAQ